MRLASFAAAAPCLLLLAADLFKRLLHVRIEAGAVAEVGIENVFHAVSCLGSSLFQSRPETLRAGRGLGGLSVRRQFVEGTTCVVNCDAGVRLRAIFSQLANRRELRAEHRQLAFDGGDFLLVLRLARASSAR
jgi:hypothetical protein